MNALAAIAELQRRGLDVFVCHDGEIWLRAGKDARISNDDITFARENRAAIAAFGSEFSSPKGTHVDYRL